MIHTVALVAMSVAGAGTAGVISRHPHEYYEMVQALDEQLLQTVAWFVDGPRRGDVMPFEIMDAIGGRRGLLRLLGQARLMTGIAAEAKKLAKDPVDVAKFRRQAWALWRAVGLCMFWSSGYAHSVAATASAMAAELEDVLIAIDLAGMPAL